MKTRLLITLFFCFAVFRPCWSQMDGRPPLSLDSVVSLTNILLNSRQFDQAKFKIDSLLDLLSKGETSKSLLIELKIRSLQGKYLLMVQKNEDWPDLYSWCIEQESISRSEKELDLLVRLFNNAGIAFKRLGRFSDSEEAFLKSSEILRKLKNPDYILYGSVYTNAGNSLKQMGEFGRSIEYFQQSISYFDQYVESASNPGATARIAGLKSTALDNLGLVYQALGDHRKALEVFKTCIDFKLKNYPLEINDVYSNLVISLIETGEYAEAKHIVELILSDFKPRAVKSPTWALAKLNLADLDFRMTSDTVGFFHELELLNRIIQSEIPEAIDISIISNQLMSNLLMHQRKHAKALDKWSEAIGSLSLNGQRILPNEVPYSIKTLKFNKLIELMNLNAKIYYDWGKQKQDYEILSKAEERYSFTLKLIDSLRNSLEMQSSKLEVSRMQRSNYNQLIELEFSNFMLTGDTTHISGLFTAMEQSKSAGLWSSVRASDYKSSMLPQADLERENAIQKKIADIQGKIIEAGAAQYTVPERIRDLQQENLFYNQQLDSLKQVYRQKYPDYFKAKFDRSTISLDQVKRLLQPGQVLIEYAIAYDYLYTLTVTNEESRVSRLPMTQKTIADVAYILEFMKGHMESLTSAARTRYVEAASALFEILITPSLTLSTAKEFLIIPDGSLSYLPFEALLEPQSYSTRQDYRRLPYLIRNHSVSYGLTATVFFYKTSRITKPTRRVLAVAPSYNFASVNVSDYLRKAQTGLPELKGTFEESKTIKKMLGGRLLVGKEATEEKFKEIASRYSILHLAMHSIPDNVNSLNSSLVFTPGADKKEDGVLYGHEVYNLSLNAWLTVLSACETGSGQMASGEGVLSFGRAFIVAGCPNLVMTLWTVDDRSSERIMVSFYKALLSGSGIADALQTSKKLYLEQVDQLHAHPHYWAGFIELGQNQIIKIPAKRPALIYLLLLSAVTILIIVILQSRKNPRRSGDIKETE